MGLFSFLTHLLTTDAYCTFRVQAVYLFQAILSQHDEAKLGDTVAKSEPARQPRPGHRTIIKERANLHLRTLLAEGRGGVNAQSMRDAIAVVSAQQSAVVIREVAADALAPGRSIDIRVDAARTRLHDLALELLAQYAPDFALPANHDEDFVKQLTELLATRDEDEIFAEITVILHETLTPHLERLLINEASHLVLGDIATQLFADLNTGLHRVRHREYHIVHSLDFLHTVLGWHLRDAGCSRLAIAGLVGVLDPIDTALQARYPDMIDMETD